MNKFIILSCIDVKENDYDGPCIVLGCISDPSFMLFFPISEENAKVITYVLEGNDDYDINTNILGIYRTMVNSWQASDRYLSGIIMDAVYDKNVKDELLSIRLALSNQENGDLDSLVPVNFLHAVLLAAMERVEIIVSEKLLEQMMPSSEKKERDERRGKNNKSEHFPEDKALVDIAKKIMSGKVKGNDVDDVDDVKQGKNK